MNPNQNDVVVNVGTNSRGAQTDIQRLERSIQGLERATSNVKDFRGLAQSAKAAKTATDSANTSASSLAGTMGTLTGLAVTFTAAIGAMLTLNAYHRIADEATMLQNRLRLAHDTQLDVIAAHEKLYKIARATRGQLDGMGDLYYRMSNAARATGRSQADVFKSVKSIQLATRISNAPAESAKAAITQLNQAMASGVLRGEEFNSISEQLPRMAEAIASHLGVGLGGLRKMAEDGLLTSEVVFSAMLSQASVMEKEFGRLKATAAEGFSQMTLAGGKFVSEIESTFNLAGKMADRLLRVADAFDTVTPTIKTAVFEVKSLLDSAYLDIQAGKGVGDMSPENLLKLQKGLRKLHAGENPLEKEPEAPSIFGKISSAFDFANNAGERLKDTAEDIKKGFIVVFYAGKSMFSLFNSMGILIPKVFGPAFTLADHLEVAMGRASAQLEVFTRAQRSAIEDWVNHKIEATSFFQVFDTRIERGFRHLFRATDMGVAVEAARDISEALDSRRGGTLFLTVRDAEESMASFMEKVRTGLVFLDLAERRVFAIHNIRFDRLSYGLGVAFEILRDLYNLTIGKGITLLVAELEAIAFKAFLLGSALFGIRHDFVEFGGMAAALGKKIEPVADMFSEVFSGLADSASGLASSAKERLSGISAVVEGGLSEIARIPRDMAYELEGAMEQLGTLFESRSLAERLNDWLTGDGGIDSVIKQISLAGIGAAIFRLNIPLALTFSLLTMGSVRKLLVPVLTELEEAIADSKFGAIIGSLVDDLGRAIAEMAFKVQAGAQWFIKMLDLIGSYTDVKLDSVSAVVSEFADKVERAFFWVYDRVVGHSWWPDLIDGVIDHASRLGSSAMKMVTKFTSGVDEAFSSLADRVGFTGFDKWMTIGDDDEQVRKQLLIRYAAIALTVAGMPAIGIPLAFVSTESGRDVVAAFIDEYEAAFTGWFGGPLAQMLSSARMLRRELTDTTFVDSAISYIKHKVSIVTGLLNAMGAKFHMFGGAVSNMSTLDLLKAKVDGIKETLSSIVAHVELSVDAQAMLGHLGRVMMAAVSILFGPIWLKALSAMSLQDYVESYVALPLVDSFEYIFGTHLPSLIAEFVGSTLGSIGASIVNTLPQTVEHIFRSLPSLSETFFGQFGGVVALFGSLLSIVLSTIGTIFSVIPGTGLLGALLFGFVGYKTLTAKDKLDGFQEAIFGAAATGKKLAKPGLQQMLFPQMLDGAAGALRFNSALMKLAVGVGVLSPLLISSVSALDGFAAAATLASLAILGGGGVAGQLSMLGAAMQSFGLRVKTMTGIGGGNRLKTLFSQIINMGNMAAQAFESNRAAMSAGAMSIIDAASSLTSRSSSSAGNMASTQSIAGPMAAQIASVKLLAGSMLRDVAAKAASTISTLSAFAVGAAAKVGATIASIKSTMLGAFAFKAVIATIVVLLLSLATSANAATGSLGQVQDAGVSLTAAVGMLATGLVGLSAALTLNKFLSTVPVAERSWRLFGRMFVVSSLSMLRSVKEIAQGIAFLASGTFGLLASAFVAAVPSIRKASIYTAFYVFQLASLAKWVPAVTKAVVQLSAALSILYGRLALALTGVIASRVMPALRLFTAGLVNIISIARSLTILVGSLGTALVAALAVGTALVGIALFGKGDNILEKIKNIGVALKEAVFPAAKAWKEALPDRKFGATKFEFANRIDTLDIPSMNVAEKAHFERVNTRVSEVMQQTQEFYDTQGYLTQEQNEAAERAYAEWQRVFAMSGAKKVGSGGLARMVEEAQSISMETVTDHLRRFYTGMAELGSATADAIGLNTQLGQSLTSGVSSIGVWMKDFLFTLITAVGTTVEQFFIAVWEIFIAAGWFVNKLFALDITGAFWLLADTLVGVGIRLWMAVSSIWDFVAVAFRPVGAVLGALVGWISGPTAELVSEVGTLFGSIWDKVREGLDLGWRLFRGKGISQGEALSIEMANGLKFRGVDTPEYAQSSTVDQLRLFDSLKGHLSDGDVKLVTDATLKYIDAEKNWRGTAANSLSATKEEMEALENAAKAADKALLELLYDVNQRAAVSEGISTYTADIEAFLKRMSATGGEKMDISKLFFGGEERDFVDSFAGKITEAAAQLKTILGSNDATAVPIRVQVAGLTKTRNDLAKLFNEVAFFDGEIDLAVNLSGWELSKSQMEDLFVSNESAYAQAMSLTNKLARLKAIKAGMGANASRDERVKIISDIRAVEAELLKLKPTGVAIAAVMKEALSEVKAENFSIGAIDLDAFVQVQQVSEDLKKAREKLKEFEEGQKNVNKLNGKLTAAEYQAEWNRLNNSVSNFRQQLSMIVMPDSKLISEQLGSVSDGPAEKARMMSESMQAQAKQDAMAVKTLQDTITQLESKGATMTQFDRGAVRDYQREIQRIQGSYKKVFEAPKSGEKKEKKEKKEYKNIFERFSEHFKKNGNIDIKLEDFGLMNASVQKKIRELAGFAQAEFDKLDQKEGYMPINPDAFRVALRKFNEFKDEIEDRMKKANFDSFWESISANAEIDVGVATDKNLFGQMAAIESKMASIARRRKAIAPESDGNFSKSNLEELKRLAAEEKQVTEQRQDLARDNQTIAKQLETVMSALGINIDQVSTEADANKLLEFYLEISNLQRSLAAGNLTPASWIANQEKLKNAVEKASIALEGELAFMAKTAGMELSTDIFDSSEVGAYIKLIREAGSEFKAFEEAKQRVLNGFGNADDKQLIEREAARRRREANLARRAELSRNVSSMRSNLGISDEALVRLRNSEIRGIIAGRNKLADIEEKLFSIGTDNLGVMKEQLRESILINEAEAKLVAAAERYKEVRDSLSSSMSGAISKALSGEEGRHLADFLMSAAKTVIDDFSGRIVEAWLKPISEGFGTMLTRHGESFSKMLSQAPSWISSMSSMGIDKLFGAGSSKAVGMAVSDATSFLGSAIGSAVDGVFGEGTASSWLDGLFGGKDDDSSGGLLAGAPDGSEKNPFWVQFKDRAFNRVPEVPGFDAFGTILGAGLKIAGAMGFGEGVTSLAPDMAGPVMPTSVFMERGLTAGAENLAKFDIGGYLAGAFDSGGIVPGPVGSAQLALVHGGETILPTHKRAIQGLSESRSGGTTNTFNLSVTGDISRQTRRTIVEMLPTIASGVNSANQESGNK